MKPDLAPRTACEEAARKWLQEHLPASCCAPAESAPSTLAVAFSGGADSTAMLLAARAHHPGRLVALHVNHGLQAAADDFEAHVRRVCAVMDVQVRVAQVRVPVASGQSLEEAARTARYGALADLAKECGATWVLLGQHADDQAESLMLALSRGAGLPGLSGMGASFERNGMRFARPLLHLSAATLRAYVEVSGTGLVDDPSNSDHRFTRNRIRGVLMPAWERCFPGFRDRLLRSMGHAAQAQRLLDELARSDLADIGVPPRLKPLQALSRDRQTNALRHWLRAHEARWVQVPCTVKVSGWSTAPTYN